MIFNFLPHKRTVYDCMVFILFNLIFCSLAVLLVALSQNFLFSSCQRNSSRSYNLMQPNKNFFACPKTSIYDIIYVLSTIRMIIASIAGYEIFSYCHHLVPTKIKTKKLFQNEMEKFCFIFTNFLSKHMRHNM